MQRTEKYKNEADACAPLCMCVCLCVCVFFLCAHVCVCSGVMYADAGVIRFMDVQNIHVMRASFQKLQALCLKHNPSDHQFLSVPFFLCFFLCLFSLSAVAHITSTNSYDFLSPTLFVVMFAHLPVCLSVPVCVGVSLCGSVCVCVFLSACLSVCLSICVLRVVYLLQRQFGRDGVVESHRGSAQGHVGHGQSRRPRQSLHYLPLYGVLFCCVSPLSALRVLSLWLASVVVELSGNKTQRERER